MKEDFSLNIFVTILCVQLGHGLLRKLLLNRIFTCFFSSLFIVILVIYINIETGKNRC